jgi:hypothetical protein
LVPEKYGSSTSPVAARTAGSWPASLSSRQIGAVRRSCQTIALCTGASVARSHTTIVSRWLVIPIARTSASRAAASASRATREVTSQISSASCSTQPGLGKCCVNSE